MWLEKRRCEFICFGLQTTGWKQCGWKKEGVDSFALNYKQQGGNSVEKRSWFSWGGSLTLNFTAGAM